MSSILIGRILGPHGIRGAVKLHSLAATPADIATYAPLRTADGRRFTILKLKPAKDHFIADLAEVKDRTAAEALVNVELFVAREQLPAAAAGEFYLVDLVGKPVTADGTVLGKVAGLQNYGAGDLLELEGGALIPVAFVAEAGETVTVNLPPGFLEEASREDQFH
ncbi:MAG: ribosome maturation factor RimM [Hyphomicrobiales bacterium]